MIEEWRDDASWKSHRQSAHATQFQEKLKALRVGPYDERLHYAHAVGTPAAASGNGILVVTHVDVVPPGHIQVREMLKTLAERSARNRETCASILQVFCEPSGAEGGAISAI